jgi:hypothetical protein
MSIPAGLLSAVGSWNGRNELHLPEEPVRSVASTALVSAIAQSRFATFTYTWSYDNQPQEGMLLIGTSGDPAIVTVAFIDSWHMGDTMMICEGTVSDDGTVDVLGSYAVEGSADWGWRMVVRTEANELQLTMYNVAPDGEEYLGVDARYTRSA